MPLPQPKTALNNACSVIFNNTLYTYSADAFQSLRLEPGAEWEVLPQGEKVTGGVCVGSTTGTPSTSAFFVVGGVSDTEGYHGLQKYTYATGQWESIKLSTKATHQRVGHNAVYINSTDSILVYAGNQNGQNAPSSQTFTIGASAPYAVSSYPTGGTPALNPILLPWSAGEAVLLGGSTWNTQVTLFSAADGTWKDSGASLAAPLPKDTSAIQAVVMTGDDGSKNLITFDMSVSPNAVKRTVLFTGPGEPVPEAAPARRRLSRRKQHESSRKAARADEPLTLNNWPPYNSTGAPRVTRSNFAFAQGPDGMVVIAGGTAADDDLLCMFNARENSWEDPESKLIQVKILASESSTTSSTSSSTSAKTTTPTSTTLSSSSTSVSASATSPAVATQTQTEADPSPVSDTSHPHLNTILGGVLGGILGLAVILTLLYICIRRRKNQRAQMDAGHARQSNGASLDEKDDFGFAKETLAFGQGFRGHKPQGSQSSFSSMAILMGRAGQSKLTAGLSRKSSNESKRKSSDSIYSAFKNTISKPIPHPAPDVPPLRLQQDAQDPKVAPLAANTAEPRARTLPTGGDEQGTTRRSSGWNRYWSGGSALNLLGFGSGNSNSNSNSNIAVARDSSTVSNSQRTTLRSVGSSNYSNPHRITQDSATVPPLFPAAAESRMSLSRVNAHSPTIAVYDEKLNEGMSGQIETQRPISSVSDLSASAYSSGIPESVQDAWDPTAANKPWGADRSLNDSFTGTYPTALAPASQGLKPPSQGPSRPAPPQREQTPVRDDMSWLNLNAN
ncbi:hypothetical protein MYCTH_2296409 [Thermothelomyces thermophilus ATCC 42464]|uniref:Pre-mRNA splicing factor CLF1 n=1 Tax=Thermothelomyces thermophilus (strain ATCC 42464 / BCRC 31852 / DSM 1799) TaxID=573729 RepID=G2Q1H6_THET4|nr:uncharacterized protein MYCTH_2296409 [Thermothelomyces thermophilus ATCC 42464]AEO54166.1 hypothetical protein MYCTH_2296409 [Thermothelomyces thermophilus ATCC 42464]